MAVRPIRIEQRDTGLGPPAAVPTIEGATAPARALGELGAEVGRDVAAVAGEQVRRADNLSFVRESAIARERNAALEAKDAVVLDDYLKSGQYTEEGYLALREKLLKERHEAVREGLSHPSILEAIDGRYLGELEADQTSALRGNHRRLNELAIEDSGSMAVRDIQLADFDGMVVATQRAAAELSRILADDRELLPQVQAERERVFRAARNRAAQHGALGQIRFLAETSTGTFNELGLDVTGGQAGVLTEQFEQLGSELLKEQLKADTYGSQKATGGIYQDYNPAPQLLDLEALKHDVEALPAGSFERAKLLGQVTTAQRVHQRRGKVMQDVVDWLNGADTSFGPFASDSELQYAVGHVLRDQVIPRLNRPDVPITEKQNTILRFFRTFGYAPMELGNWMSGIARRSASQDPALPANARAISNVLAILGPHQALAVNAKKNATELQRELLGLPIEFIDDQFLSAEDRSVYQIMAEYPAMDDGQALAIAQAQVLSQGQKASASVSDLALPKGGIIGASDRDRAGFFAKAERVAKEFTDRLRNDFKVKDVDLQPGVIDQLRARAEFLFESNHVYTEQGLEQAYRQALDEHYKDNPPMKVHERVVMDGQLRKVLEPQPDGSTRWPTQLLELEGERWLEERGKTITPELLKRVLYYKPPGSALGPNQFNVYIYPEDGDGLPEPILRPGTNLPDIIDFDPSKSLYRDMEEQAKFLGLNQQFLKDSSEKTLPEMRTELVESMFMTEEEWNRFTSTYTRGLGTPAPRPAEPGLHFLQRRDAQALDVKEFRLRPTTPLQAAQAVQQEQRLSIQRAWNQAGGKDLFFAFPTLAKEYREGFDAFVKAQEGKRPGFRDDLDDPIRGTSFQRWWAGSLSDAADRSARARVRERIQREFKAITVPEYMQSVQSGVLPSERKKP